jgi:neutral ceramidase
MDPLQGRGFKEAQRIGSAVALAAAAVRTSVQPVSGPIAWSSQRVPLSARRISAEQLAWAQQVLADSAVSGVDPRGQTDGIPDLLFARSQLELAQRNEPYLAEIQVLRIGDVAIVGLPGEFFVEFGLAIKQQSPARATFVAGLANGSLGYVPTVAAFAEGGYEPTTWHYSKLAPDAGPICVAAAEQQLQALFGQ